ncbi:MAG TPA: hypothetical protein DCF63_19350 [Planctomycetaceae bacterium]|nr:hypothetical protein [Planctomycetaceae bacterium]
MTDQQLESIASCLPFNQADASTTRRFGGTGLGLRIAQSLIHRLGGSLTIESQSEVGTTVTFCVAAASSDYPVQIKTIASEAAGNLQAAQHLSQGCSNDRSLISPRRFDHPTSPDQSVRLDGVKILLAEDGIDNQKLIAHHLRTAGAEVEIAENGAVAVANVISKAISERPDVILMDMQMPELDGYSATERLREAQITTPIIALTAHALPEDRDKCLEVGCDGFATKPINRRALVQLCSDAVNWKLECSSSCMPGPQCR